MKTTHNVPLKALCLTLGVHFNLRDVVTKVRLSERSTKEKLVFLISARLLRHFNKPHTQRLAES